MGRSQYTLDGGRRRRSYKWILVLGAVLFLLMLVTVGVKSCSGGSDAIPPSMRYERLPTAQSP